MKYDARVIKEKVQAAMVILNDGSTSLDKLQSVVGLLKGVNNKLDGLLIVCEKNCRAIELAGEGAVIELAAEHLPEETDEQKKRKKVLLLFIRSWGDLKSEVTRIQAELDAGKSVHDSSFWLSAFSVLKGPLAVVTLVAIGIGVMSQTSVDVVIKNEGCSTLYGSKVPITIPGLVLPSAPLAAGQSATMTIPPLSLTVDGTNPKALSLSSLAFNFDIELSSAVTDVTFNGVSLLGSKTSIDLSSKTTNVLTLECN